MKRLEGDVLVNRYRVDTLIGEGGQALVYKGFDSRTQKNVAIKVLRAEYSQDAVAIKRFIREGEVLQRLNHPNIVKYEGAFQQDGLCFLVMGYVPGASLSKLLTRPLSTNELVWLILRVCAALEYAHHRGVIHCDVKPANIMVTPQFEVVVTDFGISRMIEAATQTRGSHGTPAYISPEQARGYQPTARSDIYSLGILMYHMLAGRRPFYGENGPADLDLNGRICWEQMNQTPVSLRGLNPNVSPKLEYVVFKCMAKQPEMRYQSMEEVSKALQAVVGDRYQDREAKKTIVQAWGEQTKENVRRNEQVRSAPAPSSNNVILSVLAVAVFALVVFFGIWGLLSGGTATPASEQGQLVLDEEFNQNEHLWSEVPGEAFLEAGEYHLWGSIQEPLTVARSEYALYRDFEMTVDARLTSNQAGSGGYGVVFQIAEDASKGYTFGILMISGDGFYSVYQVANGVADRVVGRTASRLIHKNGKSNQLGVRCQGSQISLSINGNEIHRYPTLYASEGWIGLVVESGVQAAFDHVKIWSVSE